MCAFVLAPGGQHHHERTLAGCLARDTHDDGLSEFQVQGRLHHRLPIKCFEVSFFYIVIYWQENVKCGTDSWLGICVDMSMVILNYFFTDRQSDTCAGKLVLVVQALEYHKDLFIKFRVYTDPIVFYRELPYILFFHAVDLYFRYYRSSILQRIAYKVLHQLRDLRFVYFYRWH